MNFVGIDLGRPALALRRFGVLVERAFKDSLFGEDRGDLGPFLGILIVRDVKDASLRGFIDGAGFHAAVVDGKLLEVGYDG